MNLQCQITVSTKKKNKASKEDRERRRSFENVLSEVVTFEPMLE